MKRPVIVCTQYRGVFFGYAEDTTGDVIDLKDARMAIRFGTKRGVLQLAETGPTKESNISAKADIALRGVTSVFEVSKEAEEAWLAIG
mgnify:CR=1 FL=1